MSALAPDKREKLVAILGMLGSDFDGERAAAGHLATEFLRREGFRWDDVIAPPTLPKTGPQSNDDPDPAWRETVAPCLRHLPMLTLREVEFLLGASRFPYLSDKQMRWLNSIAKKLGVRT